MLVRLVLLVLLYGMISGCSSVSARGGYYVEDGECRYSKDLLDDFGPGVERCREEAAERLNQF
ncbi:MAG: hypothetical protein JAZ19_03795 [Candidatus Thiodiazotropha taylori]|nr:hypothetical protein [Candidatus Thiodiazotropha taylori]